jgi:hypothetical protein
LPKIAVLPHLKVRGWDGVGAFNDCGIAHPVDLATFSAPQDTDAMAVSYLVPGEDAFPRLNTGALPTLIEAGQEPLVHWVFLDIDNPSHAQWTDLAEAYLALAQATQATDMGGYTTRAGLRLVAPLDPPLPASVANSWLEQFGALFPDLDIDPASYEWTRLMRLPRAKRDGQVLDSIILLDDLTPIDPHSFGFTLTEQSREVGDWGDAPPEPVVLTWEDWKHASDMTWAKAGRPVPEGVQGSCYQTARTALARIAARGDITDPHTLASYLWESVLATSGSSLDIAELWKLAGWVCDRQAEDPGGQTHERTDDLPSGEPSEEEWALVKTALTGRNSVYYGKLKDALPMAARTADQEAKTYGVLRHFVEETTYPADFYYRVFIGTATTQKKPMPPALWERCQSLVEERDTLGSSEVRVRRAFVDANPLTLSCPNPGTPLFQLDTTTTPYSYRVTSDTLIEFDFENITKPGLPFKADYAGLNIRTIIRDYGGRVDQIAYASGQAGCRFDPEHNTIHIGKHRLKQVPAVYHEDVQGWLELLGGDDVDGLLDWLSCVTYTVDQPICALYIQGAPGIGKSLLGKGIASLWGAPPIEYNKTMNSDFNAELTTCPLLFADEGVKVDRNNQAYAALQFRNIVNDTVHYVNEKFKSPVPLRGALRVLICANDENGLPFKESLGADGIEAIVQRVMYIHADPKAAAYLRVHGGRSGMGERWAPSNNDPGAIAEHLMWLRNNRKVEQAEGARFLVVGKPTQWHREFGARQGIKPSTLQVVYALLKKEQSGAATSGGVKNDPEAEVVWVRATAVTNSWDALSRSFRAKPAAIKDSLKQLAKDYKNVRFGKKQAKAYGLPWSAFVDAAVCDIEDLEEE